MYRHRKLKPIGKGNAVDVLVTPIPSQERLQKLNALKALDLTEFNSLAEQEFVKLVTGFIKECEDPPRVREVLAEAAFELDISVETAKRYLLKHSARRAEFEVVGGLVTLREAK